MLLIGAKIQEYRKNQGLSQEEFAARVGVTRQAVSKWETDKAYPDLDKLATICDILQISITELIYGEAVPELEEPVGQTPERNGITSGKAPGKGDFLRVWLLLALIGGMFLFCGVLLATVMTHNAWKKEDAPTERVRVERVYRQYTKADVSFFDDVSRRVVKTVWLDVNGIREGDFLICNTDENQKNIYYKYRGSTLILLAAAELVFLVMLLICLGELRRLAGGERAAMNGIKKAVYIVTAVLWLSALFGGLWFAGVFTIGGKSGSHKAAEEPGEETGYDGPPVWTTVFKGMKFELPQKGLVYLHGSGCMNIRQDDRYLIQIDIEEKTLDEMWADMEHKKESLIRSGYRMEKEAERVTGEEQDYIRYVISLEEESGRDFDRTSSQVILTSADEERHILVVIVYDGIDVEKLDETMRERIYDETLARAKGIWEGACPTDEADDEVGTYFMEDKSLNPDQRYITEDTFIYGDGEHSLSYRLPEHCILTADTIAGKTYYDEDHQVHIQTNVLKYTWMTAREMAESAAARELSRPLTSGEAKVGGRTFYYYTYSVLEYGRNKVSWKYRFYGYCDLEDGSVYSIFGHADDYPEATDEVYYLDWMDITVL